LSRINRRRNLLLNLGFDIFIIVFSLIFFVFSFFSFSYWTSYKGMLAVFEFSMWPFWGLGKSIVPSWFIGVNSVLFVLLCFVLILAFLSLFHTLGKIPFLQTKKFFGITGLFLSFTTLILTILLAVFFFRYSEKRLTTEGRELGFCFYTFLIFSIVTFCFYFVHIFLFSPKKILST